MSSLTVPRSALTFGFPILIAIAYTNVSDVLLRLYGIPSILQMVVVLVAIVVFLARDELQPLEIVLHPLTIAMAVYCALLFVSSAWADDLSAADFRISEAVKGLIIMVAGGALMSSWRRVRIAAATLTLVAASLAAISVFQIATHSTNQLGGLAQIQTGNLYADVAQPRAAGPVSDPNFYAQILLMTLPIAAALAASRSRMVFAFVAVVIFAGVLVTYSRGAMVSIVAMLVLVPFVLRVRRHVVWKAALAAVLLTAVTPATVIRRFHTVTDVVASEQGGQPEETRDASVDKRKLLLSVGLRMFDDAPLFGVGAGNFGRHYAHYANEVGSSAPQYDDPGDRQYPHSLYVELAAENGIAGLVTFALAMVIAFSTLTRTKTMSPLRIGILIALAGYLVSSLFLHSAYQRYLWLLLAFIPAIDRLLRQDEAVA
ncbi:MAG TPA: O-antigen ligase family protein [Thermoanaerobaculia bacterium]|jgi:O-antigen ligase|nr:O-antigen ligase family protein [Thermoanaerobaculia bacterium]